MKTKLNAAVRNPGRIRRALFDALCLLAIVAMFVASLYAPVLF